MRGTLAWSDFITHYYLQKESMYISRLHLILALFVCTHQGALFAGEPGEQSVNDRLDSHDRKLLAGELMMVGVGLGNIVAMGGEKSVPYVLSLGTLYGAVRAYTSVQSAGARNALALLLIGGGTWAASKTDLSDPLLRSVRNQNKAAFSASSIFAGIGLLDMKEFIADDDLRHSTGYLTTLVGFGALLGSMLAPEDSLSVTHRRQLFASGVVLGTFGLKCTRKSKPSEQVARR